MARLACEAKNAFYPTDPKTLQKVVERYIRFPDKRTTVLDPCCGKGDALSVFRDFNCSLYGIELNEERAQVAHKKLDRLLCADAIFGARKSNDWAGLLFLNPPYGTDSTGERLELSFVERFSPCVVKGGAMILVINPSSADEEMAKELISQGYEVVASVFDEENEDYRNYGQFFMILQKIDKRFRADLEDFTRKAFSPKAMRDSDDDLRSLTSNPRAVLDKVCEIAPGVEPKLFKETYLPEWKLGELLARSTVAKRFNALMTTSRVANNSIETPNEGQAALLLASGVINRPLSGYLLKGQVIKTQQSVDDLDDEGNRKGVKLRDAYRTVCYALNTQTLAFEKLQ